MAVRHARTDHRGNKYHDQVARAETTGVPVVSSHEQEGQQQAGERACPPTAAAMVALPSPTPSPLRVNSTKVRGTHCTCAETTGEVFEWLESVKAGCGRAAAVLRREDYSEVADLRGCAGDELDDLMRTLRAEAEMKRPTERRLRAAILALGPGSEDDGRAGGGQISIDDGRSSVRAEGSEETDSVVRLNIGGDCVCDAARSTLEQSHYFRQLFDGARQKHRDADGRIFICRDGRGFRHVLNHLRGNLRFSSILDFAPLTRLNLLEDALFYGVPALVDRLVVPPVGAKCVYAYHPAGKRLARAYGTVLDFDPRLCAWSVEVEREETTDHDASDILSIDDDDDDDDDVFHARVDVFGWLSDDNDNDDDDDDDYGRTPSFCNDDSPRTHDDHGFKPGTYQMHHLSLPHYRRLRTSHGHPLISQPRWWFAWEEDDSHQQLSEVTTATSTGRLLPTTAHTAHALPQPSSSTAAGGSTTASAQP